MSRQIEHSGVVERTDAQTVYVKITSQSACAGCHARQACGMSECEEKIISVRTADAARYAAGDSVIVGVRRGIGIMMRRCWTPQPTMWRCSTNA